MGFSKKIDLSNTNVKSIEILNEEHKKSLSSAVIRGTVGTVLLGLPGLVAGALTTKNKNSFFIKINYLDSEEFSLAEVDLKMFKALQIAITKPSVEEFFRAKQQAQSKSLKSRTTAAILALFLGGFGIHWFYLGRTGLGFLHLLFFWTFIPSIAALVNFIVFLTMSDETFAEKYS